MTIQSITTANLKISPMNVRKSKRKHIAALADDIEAHGLLHNLVGYKNGKGYYIAAGARRLEALRLLQKNGRLGKDFAVPVSVRPKKEAIELSLAENQSREDMHPADAIEAYGKLAADGLSSDDIAARFGVEPVHVNRILALADLHQNIREALAKDEISLEAARAYTLTSDVEQQLRLFSEFGDHAHMVRRALTDDKLATDGAIFELVSLTDYVEAGGTITQDLFSEGDAGYADDAQLVWSLVSSRMEEIEAEYLAEGWATIEILERQPDNYHSLNHMRPQGRREPTAKEAKKLSALEAEADGIYANDPDAQVWNNTELRSIDADIQALKHTQAFFTDDQKADGKVLIFLGYGHKLTVQPVEPRRSKAKGKDGKPDKPARYSNALCEAMQGIKLLAIREAIADNADLALDLVIAAMIENRLAYGASSPLAIRCNAKAVTVDEVLLANCTISDIETKADSQCADIDRSQLLDTIGELESEDKQKLLATLVAMLIDRSSYIPDEFFEQLDIDMGTKWQPNAAFFCRMTKTAMLDLLKDECGEAAASNCRKLAKSVLAEEIERRLADKKWMPPMLALGSCGG